MPGLLQALPGVAPARGNEGVESQDLLKPINGALKVRIVFGEGVKLRINEGQRFRQGFGEATGLAQYLREAQNKKAQDEKDHDQIDANHQKAPPLLEEPMRLAGNAMSYEAQDERYEDKGEHLSQNIN